MFLVPVTIFPFYCKNTTLLSNSCSITCTSLVSKFFCSFVDVYDYKFYNHLVIVIYLPVHLCLWQELQIRNKEVLSNMWNIYHGKILFYATPVHLHITTRSYAVSKKECLEWMEVMWIFFFFFFVNVHSNAIYGLIRRGDSTLVILRRLQICSLHQNLSNVSYLGKLEFSLCWL